MDSGAKEQTVIILGAGFEKVPNIQTTCNFINSTEATVHTISKFLEVPDVKQKFFIFIRVSIGLFLCVFIFLSINQWIYLPIYLSIYLSIHPSISIFPSIHLWSNHPSIICSFLNFPNHEHEPRKKFFSLSTNVFPFPPVADNVEFVGAIANRGKTLRDYLKFMQANKRFDLLFRTGFFRFNLRRGDLNPGQSD